MSNKKWQTPKVLFQPQVCQGMQRGINQIANAVRPTLGPFPRLVASESTISRGKKPELLDSGGTIARRIIQLQNRGEDVGAMLIRQMLWQLQERAGDGTATAAVIFQSVYNRGLRYLAAGGNAMRLRGFLERGAQELVQELGRMTVQIHGKEKLAQFAETLSNDADLSRLLGEIFDVIGEYGLLDIRPGRSRELEQEYIEGRFWEGGMISRAMASDRQGLRGQLEEASIVITDLEIDAPGEVVPLLELAASGGIHGLLLIANKISEPALSVLLASSNREKVQVLAVKTPGRSSEIQMAALQDLSILTGGQPLLKATGASLSAIKPEHLGGARRAWAGPHHFGFMAGEGDPRLLRQHIACLRKAFEHTEDSQHARRLQERIGTLMGAAATLWVGDATPSAVEARKAAAERTAQTMRGALREGVVPGGGAAYLACSQVLQEQINQTSDADERSAYGILIGALKEPMCTLLTNAGEDSGVIMARVVQAGPGCGYDVKRRQVVNMFQAGIYDPAAVARAVIHSAIHCAALALTTDVLVHRGNPPAALTRP